MSRGDQRGVIGHSDGRGNAAGLKKLAGAALSKAPRMRADGRVIVLCYHSIHPSYSYASVSPTLLEAHIEWLKANFTIIKFSDVARVARLEHPGTTSVAITFDDGYEDNHTHALPILNRHEVPATFFVTTGFIDGDAHVVARFRSVLRAGTEQVSGMSWTQVRELAAAGMDIGAHTLTHPNLALLDDRRAQTELRVSKQKTEEHIGAPVRSVAYPFGLPRRSFTEQTVRAASSAGYEFGAAILYRSVRPTDHAMRLPRIAVTRDSIDILQRKLSGAFDWLGFYQEHAPMWALTVLSKDSEHRSMTGDTR